MEIIHPNEIGSKISTLILNAKKFLYFVTPFVDISQWKKILANLKRAKEKGVEIRFYVREIKEKDLLALEKLSVPVWTDTDLHTKLYLNEGEAIVTSMNLYEYSDIYSKDIALHYKVGDEHTKLIDYFSTYIEAGNFKKIVRAQSVHTQTTPANTIEEALKSVYRDLCNLFPADRITMADQYVYFTRVISGLDAFIFSTQICFKYTINKDRSSTQAMAFYMRLQKVLPDFKIQTDKPGYWSIDLVNASAQAIKSMIDKLREDNRWGEMVVSK